MIQYIEHKNIDLDRWDSTIEAASNGLPYAYSWYLNVTTSNKWDALVLNDYEAIMPLPFNQKLFGIRQVFQPIVSQQLGVFGSTIDSKTVAHFMKAVPARFKLINQSINHFNPVAETTTMRTNLVLSLNHSFENISKAFSSSLRKNLRKVSNYHLAESTDIESLLELYRLELEDKVHFGQDNYQLAHRLFEKVLSHQKGKIYSVFNGTDLVATGMFLLSNGRVINMFGASSSDPKTPYGMAYLLAEVIRKYSETDVVFDFEGSEIPGVKRFFESFGSKNQPYSTYQLNNLPFWLAWFRR